MIFAPNMCWSFGAVRQEPYITTSGLATLKHNTYKLIPYFGISLVKIGWLYFVQNSINRKNINLTISSNFSRAYLWQKPSLHYYVNVKLFVVQNVKMTPMLSTPSSISVRRTSCLATPTRQCWLLLLLEGSLQNETRMHFHDLLWLPLDPSCVSFTQQLQRIEDFSSSLFILFTDFWGNNYAL
jgi:hypothetical protein